MAIEIVTGFQGKPHVTSNDEASFNQGIVGSKDYVLGVGKKAESTLVSNNSIRIDDGELVMQGVHFRILPGTYENVTINNGNQGMKRKDMIVARYTKDSETGIENVTLDVLQGTPTSGTPVAPVPTTGDIRTGALIHEMPLYVVELDGLNVVGVDPAFEILMNMKEMKDQLTKLNSKLMVKEYTQEITVPANAKAAVSIAAGISGYNLIGIIQVDHDDTGKEIVLNKFSNTNSRIYATIRNLWSGSDVTLNVTLKALYIKE